MRILALGLNHKTASVAVRERLAFGPVDTVETLKHFAEAVPGAEFALLSTCNRVELYAAGGEAEALDAERLAELLGRHRGVPVEEFRDSLYVRFDADAVTHLLTVGSSLDSMVVGEPQIIAQVKECYSLACEAGTTGKTLNRLFHVAFSTSKEIYTSTTITTRRVSIAGVAVDLAKQLFADIPSARILVVGAGDMGGLVVEHFRQMGATRLTVVNRSHQRAVRLAQEHGMEAAPWEQRDELIRKADIVVASAAVQDYLFTKAQLRELIHRRSRSAPLLIIDIAVPRNVEPSVNDLRNVYLYSVDDLDQVVKQNIDLRETEIDRAVEIIYRKTTEYMQWLEAMEIGPLVGQLREAFGRIRQNELERFFVGPRAEASCRETMQTMVSRVVNRLLHCVIANLNVVAREQGAEQALKMAEDILRQTQQIRDKDG